MGNTTIQKLSFSTDHTVCVWLGWGAEGWMGWRNRAVKDRKRGVERRIGFMRVQGLLTALIGLFPKPPHVNASHETCE